MRNAKGLSLLEVLIAALIGMVVAGGTMLAFTTAEKVSVGASGAVEAADFAQQTIERFRNRIACDDEEWFDPATCQAVASAAMTGWTFDPVDATDGLPDSPGTLSMIGQGGSRQYKVTEVDCDGDDIVGDCLQVEAKVTWTQRQ
jgi:hypothetical protein